MKLKAKALMSREDVARELTRLSGMIADGRIDFEGILAEFKGPIGYSLEIKHKRDSLELEFSLNIPTKETREPDKKKRSRGKATPKGRPYRAKALKKHMASLWKIFKRDAFQGEVDEKAISELLALLSEYGEMTEPEWSKEWEICASKVHEAIDSYKSGDNERLREAILKVDTLTKACHKVYK